MILYLSLVSFMLIVAIGSVDRRINKMIYYYWSALLFIVLTVFAGTRLVGHDYDAYLIHFNNVPTIWQYVRTDTSMEIGFEILVSCVKTITSSFHLFLLIFSGLTILVSFVVCKKYSFYPLLSFYMFFSYSFFLQVMGQMRQPIAILIAYLGLFPLLMQKKKMLAALWIILIGILFHKSVFFLCLFLLLADKILSRKRILFMIVGVFICYILSARLSDILPTIIPSGFPFAETVIAYLTYKSYTLNFSLGMLERIMMVTVLFYYAYKYQLYKSDLLLRILINMYFLGTCLYFAFISLSAEFASRGTQALGYSLFLALPLILKRVSLRDKYILLGIICAWGLYLSLGVLKEADIYIPYKSILF